MKRKVWIEEARVLAIHERQFVEHGGQRACATSLCCALGWPDRAITSPARRRMSSSSLRYTAGIVKNHPFVDSNKRTGFVVEESCDISRGTVAIARRASANQSIGQGAVRIPHSRSGSSRLLEHLA
jgi:death-on-curing protein